MSVPTRHRSLTAVEAGRLGELEQVVGRDLQTFIEVGNALAEIRDRRLYRQSHSKFEDYCRERWGFTRRHSNRLIQAAEVADVLGPMGPIPNERQARELAPLRDLPGRLRETWTRVVEATDGQPTAADLRGFLREEAVRSEGRGGSTHHPPGWFELLGDVGEALGDVEGRLERLEQAITRMPKATFVERAEQTAGRTEEIASRLRRLGEEPPPA